LEGHVLSPFLEEPTLEPPLVVLAASGGHTLLVHVKERDDLAVLGRTRDDAAGEAFDKVSVMLGLGYPGGAPLEKLAAGGNASAFDLPRAWLEPDTLDFSFSGVKTAVRLLLTREPELARPPRSADVAASFQAAVIEVLVEKTLRAARQTGVGAVSVVGGVAANGALREAMGRACEENRLRLIVPRLSYCGDNAAMIAYAGALRLARGERSDLTLDAEANLPLGDVANRAPRRKKRPSPR
jgi:N6-L-threonylcarbamoyladenine synthase